jgi:hypothetical protein
VSSSLALHGYSDADFAGCRLDRKSTSRTYQFLGSSLVSWSSRKQLSVAQSTTVMPQVFGRVVNPNDLVNRVNVGQTTVNLGRHLENITNDP